MVNDIDDGAPAAKKVGHFNFNEGWMVPSRFSLKSLLNAVCPNRSISFSMWGRKVRIKLLTLVIGRGYGLELRGTTTGAGHIL